MQCFLHFMFDDLSFRWIDSFALMVPVTLGLAVTKLQPNTGAWIFRGRAISEEEIYHGFPIRT